MATHSSTLAWKIPWMEEPGRLQSMGSHRVRHNWSDLAAVAATENYIESPWSSRARACHLSENYMPLKNNSMFYQALVEAKYFIMGCLMIMHLELPVMSNRITKSHSPMSTAVIHCKMEIIFQGGKVAGPNRMCQQHEQVAQIRISPTRVAPVPLLKLVPMAILQRDIPIQPVEGGLTNGCQLGLQMDELGRLV